METIILLGIGVLAAGLLVRQFVRNAKVEGCSCCEQECGNHCQQTDDQERLS
ncbi:Virus attachment protein p12 family protein [Pelotomaculum schinkii]|uniref:Virus attachment protein p12 family protein n=1 Tax=Pelotomaculum schinkii TaxID=78350 RepID=A0A4Y7RGE9_9FIRM|nr:FeoB-associated Cys-rich membrane protein [Pelotomaculum schinkii]TEB07829.1 Virus attachment protein p12 family protein [Pelotomaculum schinkii]